MEGLPKMPMLIFELKASATDIEFEMPFKRFIATHYHEDPDSYQKEIRDLEQLRRSVCRTALDVTGCALLKRYYSQMYSLANRFQIHNATLDLQFYWLNFYTDETVSGDVHFELASILYNIGTLHAELGGLDTRSNEKAMKAACTHFQCAAWAFEQIRDNPLGNKSKDLSNDFLSFLVHIMLAQAQECILEKSMLDNKKPSIAAKVAAQVCDFYDSAHMVLAYAAPNSSGNNSIQDMVGSKLFKEWKNFILLKITYYNAICALFMGQYCEDQQKFGERIAWYRIADEKLTEVIKKAKALDKSAITTAVNFLFDYIKGKLDNAQKENDLVYHEVVPSSDKLTAVKGASLVKSIPFSVSDPEVAGPDIFARLVPIQAHETASLYTEQKDSILRDIRVRIEAKNRELENYMSALNLSLDHVKPKVTEVPDELIEMCAALSVTDKPGQKAKDQLQQLTELGDETDAILKQSRMAIKQEEIADKEHELVYGKSKSAATTNVMADLSKELAKHEEAYRKACQSNDLVKEKFLKHIDDIVLLSDPNGKGLNNILPAFVDIPYDLNNVKELETLLAKVEEMKSQRLMLEKQLRDAIQKDDVMSKVLTHSKEEIKSVFEKEAQKYEKQIQLIDQNLSAQENILNALTKANARYAATRKAVNERKKERDQRISDLLLSYEEYQNMLTNIEKGIDFFTKFKEIVTVTRNRIKKEQEAKEKQRLTAAQANGQKLQERQTLRSAMLSGTTTTPLPSAGLATAAGINPQLLQNQQLAQQRIQEHQAKMMQTGAATVPQQPNYWPQPQHPTAPNPYQQPVASQHQQPQYQPVPASNPQQPQQQYYWPQASYPTVSSTYTTTTNYHDPNAYAQQPQQSYPQSDWTQAGTQPTAWPQAQPNSYTPQPAVAAPASNTATSKEWALYMAGMGPPPADAGQAPTQPPL